MLLTILLASFLVMVMSLSGKLLAIKGIGAHIERNLHYFVSAAAGVLLVVAYNLSSEIIEHTGAISSGLPWIALGSVLVLIAFKYIPQFHHHHDVGDHAHTQIDGNRVLASDAIHNIGDGIVIVVSFAASTALGIASTISIVIHEMLQEISEYFVLREAGMSVRTALLFNFAASSTILIGAIGAYFLLERFEALEIPLLGLSVGAYLVVVFHDLIPHSITASRVGGHYVRHILFFITGAALMFALQYALPHAEPEHEEHHVEVAEQML